jgi:thioesterase domain-containing protein
LFPDGSGSVGSYASLPDLDVNSESPANMSVWGLNSPFVLWTEPFEASFVSMAEMYVAEILRVDPEGPYLLGGW